MKKFIIMVLAIALGTVGLTLAVDSPASWAFNYFFVPSGCDGWCEVGMSSVQLGTCLMLSIGGPGPGVVCSISAIA